jgi:hypothetical protein
MSQQKSIQKKANVSKSGCLCGGCMHLESVPHRSFAVAENGYIQVGGNHALYHASFSYI